MRLQFRRRRGSTGPFVASRAQDHHPQIAYSVPDPKANTHMAAGAAAPTATGAWQQAWDAIRVERPGAVGLMVALAEQAWAQGDTGPAANAAGAVVLVEHLTASRHRHAERMLRLMAAIGIDHVEPGPGGLTALAGAAVAHDYGALPSWPAVDMARLRDLARVAPADVALAAGCALGEVCERNGLSAEFASLHAQLAAVRTLPGASAFWRGHWAITCAWQLSSTGDRDAAHDELCAAQEEAAAAGLDDLAANLALQHARLVDSLQDPVAALALAQQAVAGASPASAPLRFADLADVQARIALRRLDFHAAMAHARRAGGLAEAAGVWPGFRVTYAANEGAALMGSGSFELASAAYGQMAETLTPRYLSDRASVMRDFALLARCAHNGVWAPQSLSLLGHVVGRLRLLEWHGVLSLLPDMVARVLDKALEAGIETDWVRAAVRFRRLKAPPGAPFNWPWPVVVRVLGDFDVVVAAAADRDDADASRKAPGKPLDLLRCLAARGHAAVGVDDIAQALWPGDAREGRQKAFDTTVGRLRRHLGSNEAVVVSDRRIRLNAQIVWVDLAALLAVLDQADAAESDAACAAKLEAAVRLYRGPCLADSGDTWARRPRDSTRLRLAASLRRAGARGPGAALGWLAQQAMAADHGLLLAEDSDAPPQ
jgi:hypothetical protein